jgi:CBS domain-containing protein
VTAFQVWRARIGFSWQYLMQGVDYMQISDATGPLPSAVHTVKPGDTIADTVDLLSEHGIGAVVVTTDGSAVDGIISERDIVRFLAHEQEGTLRIPVEDLMTRSVITCSANDQVDAVIDTMIKGRFRHMPVVDAAGSLCGLVSLADLTGVLLATRGA